MDIVWETLKILLRRKVRTALTVLGMALGVFAFLVMGAMAEHFDLLARHFERLYTECVFVCERVNFWAGGGILSQGKVKKVRAVPGVEEIIPTLINRFREKQMIVIGIPEVILGVPPAKARKMAAASTLKAGRWLEEGDSFTAVAGFDMARSLALEPGGEVTFRGKRFTVVGTLEKSGALDDRQIIVPLGDLQAITHREGLITNMLVFPKEGVSPESLSEILKRRVAAVEVIPPSRMKEEVESALALWRVITMGCGFVAALIGAISIVVTMFVSLWERYREIGIRKALGASSTQIMAEFVVEALIVSVTGWVLGAAAAALFVVFYERGLSYQGIALFTLTQRIFVASFLMSVFLGVLSGALPALQAAKVDPVRAMKKLL